MPDNEPSDDSSSNGESDENSQPTENVDDSGTTENKDNTNSITDEKAPESNLLKWFQSLDRKEKIGVIVGSLAIVNGSEDVASSVIEIVDEIESTESQNDPRDRPVYPTDESDLSPPDQYPSPDYETPDEGEGDWHIPLNKNFKQIEEDIEFLNDEVIKLGGQTEKEIKALDKKIEALDENIEALDEKVELLEEKVDDTDA